MKLTGNVLCGSALKAASLASLLALGQSAFANGDVWFTPLTESAPVTPPNSMEELTAPWVAPEGIMQLNIVSLAEVENVVLSPNQSIVRVPDDAQIAMGSGLGTASMFDMIAYSPDGKYIFIPHETIVGAGVSRYNFETRETQVLFQGDLGGVNGDWSWDFGAFDPCRFTPNGTLFLGEEWSGQGRIIEVLNPFDDPEDIEIRELHSIANVSHEGINFSIKYLRPIYYVDEDNSGSIYKFVRTNPEDYTKGQTFVLKVDAFQGDPSANWNSGANANEPRTGKATWVPITDFNGNPLTNTNPFEFSAEDSRPGRTAADEIGGTPYGRPEDGEVKILRNRNEAFLFAATSENRVYTVENTGGNSAIVRVFMDGATTPKNPGFAPTTGVLNSPDNLAIDALGNIYIIEDAPNGSSTGGDIWMACDQNNDGVAEGFFHFLSIRADGCEATGMIWNPANPCEFVVAVQHPDSTNLTQVPNGLGDAVWKFDVSKIADQAFVSALKAAVK